MLQSLFSLLLTSHAYPFRNPFQPFRIKCERYIFLEKCVHSSLCWLCFCMHMSMLQQEHTYISSIRTQDAVWRTCRQRWLIRTDGQRKRETERDRKERVENLGDLCNQHDSLIMMMMMINLQSSRTVISNIMHPLPTNLAEANENWCPNNLPYLNP